MNTIGAFVEGVKQIANALKTQRNWEFRRHRKWSLNRHVKAWKTTKHRLHNIWQSLKFCKHTQGCVQGVKILSCIFWEKNYQIIAFHIHLWSWRPLLWKSWIRHCTGQWDLVDKQPMIKVARVMCPNRIDNRPRLVFNISRFVHNFLSDNLNPPPPKSENWFVTHCKLSSKICSNTEL